MRIIDYRSSYVWGMLAFNPEKYKDIIIKEKPEGWDDNYELDFGWRDFWIQYNPESIKPPLVTIDEPENIDGYRKTHIERAFISREIQLEKSKLMELHGMERRTADMKLKNKER